MKTLKFTFALMLSLLVFAACSKKTDDAINPDSGAEVAGTYNVTKIRQDDGTMLTVQPGYTKTVQLIRLSETEVDVSLTLGEPGKAPVTLNGNEAIDLKRSGQTINLVAKNGSQLGSYTAKTLELKLTQAGQSGTFIGTKP